MTTTIASYLNEYSTNTPVRSYKAWPVCSNKQNADLWILNTTSHAAAVNGSSTPEPYIVATYYESNCWNWFHLLQNETTRGPVRNEVQVWDKAYSMDRDNYQCVSKDVYQWVRPPFSSQSLANTYEKGFSYAFLLLASSLNALWLLGTYFLWLDAERNSILVKAGRDAGPWRATLDLALVTEAELHEQGYESNFLGEKAITDRLKKARASIGYVIEEEGGRVRDVRLRRRVRGRT